MGDRETATIGIVTALPIECAAMRAMIDSPDTTRVGKDPNPYEVGTIPSADSKRPHDVALCLLADDGTRNAAAASTELLHSFPSIRVVIMCGIAGGVPAPGDYRRHVRLGDIVVATEGVVDYDHVWTIDGTDHLRRVVGGHSSHLQRAQRHLEMKAVTGVRPWEATLTGPLAKVFPRPAPDTDVLLVDGRRRPHPPDANRVSDDLPRVHPAAIGSADRLLRDAVLRDGLAMRYGIQAVEMEASGIAVGTALQGTSWYVVRGIADYCDNATKNDVWHPYASFAAAAYTRALLGACQPFDVPARQPVPSSAERPGPLALKDLNAMVHALQEIDLLGEPAGRLLLVSLLPREISGNIPYDARDRIHLIHLVRGCTRYPHGREALLAALEEVAPEGSTGLALARDAVHRHWPT